MIKVNISKKIFILSAEHINFSFVMPYYRFRIINEEKDELASVCSVDSSTSCSPFESAWPTSFMTASEHCITVHAVTKASPSPIIYCTENAHHDKHISHIEVSDSEPGHSKSCSETAVSKKLQDVHIVRAQDTCSYSSVVVIVLQLSV